MNRSNALTVVAAVAAVVIPYLLTQTDVSVPPLLKVILTAANLALVVIARLSGTTAVPVAEIASPVQTPSGDAAVVAPTDLGGAH